MWDFEREQKEGLVKEMLLMEDHLSRFPCPHCLFKHCLTIEALAEENIRLCDNEKERQSFVLLAKRVRIIRLRLPGKIGASESAEIRKMRKKLQEDLEEMQNNPGRSCKARIRSCERQVFAQCRKKGIGKKECKRRSVPICKVSVACGK